MAALSLEDLYKRRKIVIHHTHLLKEKINDFLEEKDIVFFDDCLFSQYIFLKKYKDLLDKKNIDYILGFSSGLYAPEDCKEQICEVESHILHDACNRMISCIDDADRMRNSLEEIAGFMKVSQIKELIQLPNIHLAFHGCCHLHLREIKSLIDKINIFKKDIDDGLERLKQLKLSTSIYIYPYIYSFPISDLILKKSGYKIIIGSTLLRASIEDLANENKLCYDA